jgi:hypothetical protein
MSESISLLEFGILTRHAVFKQVLQDILRGKLRVKAVVLPFVLEFIRGWPPVQAAIVA